MMNVWYYGEYYIAGIAVAVGLALSGLQVIRDGSAVQALFCA